MILFDLDGTLIDSNGVWTQIDIDFLAQRGHPCPKEYSAAVAHMTFPEAARYTKARFSLRESPEEIQRIWLSMAQEQYSSRIPLKEGVLDYLLQQSAQGVPMGIVTSCMEPLCTAVLRQHGIEGLFCQVTTTAQVAKSKSSPDVYLLAARQAGLPPQECTVFEDSPVAARSARGAGMQVVGVYDFFYADCRQEMTALCHQYIESFSQLLSPSYSPQDR
ncbi:MAG: HAD family phosphatase [Oscillospiraceae bacterium]|nr:HAD family phosphatase [Oscillospiraceae bacterium]